jgi:hypothetical protein|eukprot:CAMPEP_0174343130 /NCGR_PEP_ID=MMETSP0810-20121108/26710_1 /TAXON_ID=73025 ORGANISM="Eutreptiella gymnastica-like, Strain CCMP1594" /NCGR_SAMPLE_ID=MMETSP0810 /ASSEMBLY_ACC=CAM_ASM_000659 /LENGTH=43 /DNA_ID= /DNA_START= /DNA_END= /DNA_ORIENTATION=
MIVHYNALIGTQLHAVGLTGYIQFLRQKGGWAVADVDAVTEKT